MRTETDDNMELSFDYKKTSPKLCNTDVCICYLWHISYTPPASQPATMPRVDIPL